jgi:hypothetical protein
MGLPPEIRNYIFTLLLVEPEPLTADVSFIDINNGYRSRPGPPPLARVSRQLRQEAISIFYGHNVFSFMPIRGNVYSDHYTSPFRWRLGLLNYHSDIPRHIRRLFLDIRVPHASLVTNIIQCSDGNITVDVRVGEASNPGSLLRPNPCVCGFEDTAPGAIRQWDLDGSDKVYQIAECFYRRCAVESALFTGDKERRRRCSNTSKCGKGSNDRAMILISGDGEVRLIAN